jgi:hypothetical protein
MFILTIKYLLKGPYLTVLAEENPKMNFSERSVDKLKDSPERSEGEDQISVACEGKFMN